MQLQIVCNTVFDLSITLEISARVKSISRWKTELRSVFGNMVIERTSQVRCYTMKQKCLLARAFLRSRQCCSRAEHGAAYAAKAYAVRLSANIIPCSHSLGHGKLTYKLRLYVIPCPVSCYCTTDSCRLSNRAGFRMVNRAPSLQPKMTRRNSESKKRTDIHFCTSVRRFYEIDLSPFAGYAPVRFTVRRFSVRICPGLW